MVNPFEVLEISIDEVRGKDEGAVRKLVESAHKELYKKTVGGYANVPRKDGLSNTEYQNRLNQAKKTLLDPQERRKLIADLAKADETAKQAETAKQTAKQAEAAKQAAEQAAKQTAKQAEAAKQAAEQAARQASKEVSKQAKAAKQALKPVVAGAARRLVDYAGIITIVAIVLMVLGTVLAGFGVVPLGPGIKWLGDVAFPFGFTAFLYKGSRRRAVVFGAVGIVLLVLAFLAPTFLSNVNLGGPIRNLPTFVVGSIWNLGVVVLMCGFVSFLLTESRYAKVLAVARPVTRWWMAMIAQQPLLIRAGAHSVAIGLILLVLGFFMDILLLGNSGFGRLGGGLIGSGLLLVVIGFFWRP